MKKLLLSLIGLLVVAGCTNLPASYVAADRQTFNATKPLLDLTAKDHPDLSQPITDLERSWDMRVSNAEKSLAPVAPTTAPAATAP